MAAPGVKDKRKKQLTLMGMFQKWGMLLGVTILECDKMEFCDNQQVIEPKNRWKAKFTTYTFAIKLKNRWKAVCVVSPPISSQLHAQPTAC
jgi:hypothetical protein